MANIVVYSMFIDGPVMPASGMATPASGAKVTLNGVHAPKPRTYIAGSKALDSLIKFLVNVESFFHPNNAGHWTASVSLNPTYFTVFKFVWAVAGQFH